MAARTPDDFKDTPLENLAAQRDGLRSDTPTAILIDNEFARRNRLHQHELDLDLVAKQVRWMKFAAILGSAATLIGAIVGALLIFWLQKPPPTKATRITNAANSTAKRGNDIG